ncbi:Major ampullate spidroin 1 MaSp1 [Nitrospirillum viridazoti Y2]|nr:Major ampullate spidroin 1 MaSp1 [Nitrospirillum amazonense Y2]
MDSSREAPLLTRVLVPTLTASFSSRLPEANTTLALVLVIRPRALFWPVRTPKTVPVPPVNTSALALSLTILPAMVPLLATVPSIPLV